YGHEDETRSKAIELITRYEDLLKRLDELDLPREKSLLNNFAFAFIEAGQFEQAQRYLTELSNAIHKDPYPTATLGLLHMRRGHFERGESLYEEAIHIARSPLDKARL